MIVASGWQEGSVYEADSAFPGGVASPEKLELNGQITVGPGWGDMNLVSDYN